MRLGVAFHSYHGLLSIPINPHPPNPVLGCLRVRVCVCVCVCVCGIMSSTFGIIGEAGSSFQEQERVFAFHKSMLYNAKVPRSLAHSLA